MLEVTKRKLSASLKRKWASGTRIPNPESYGDKISAALKIAHAEGRGYVIKPEHAKLGHAHVDKEKLAAMLRLRAKARIGTLNPPGLSGRGPAHHKSRYWIIQNVALGVTLEGLNLNHLVRENSQHFNDDDLNWKKGMCRASQGLRHLFQKPTSTGKPAPHSWKGWTAVDVK
jgi:hypothetical protein